MFKHWHLKISLWKKIRLIFVPCQIAGDISDSGEYWIMAKSLDGVMYIIDELNTARPMGK